VICGGTKRLCEFGMKNRDKGKQEWKLGENDTAKCQEEDKPGK